MSSVVLESSVRQAASFDAVRRRVFLEMHSRTRRWLAMFVVPTYLSFALVLAISGSYWRALVQIVALVVCFSGAMMSRRRSLDATPFAWTVTHHVIVLAVSGGIASPMLAFGFPLASAGMVVVADKKQKIALAIGFTLAYALLAIVSVQPWGGPPPPFTHEGAFTSTYFVTMGCVAALAVVGSLRMGMVVTGAYARVAEELAARREQICEASSNHSRMLEGVAARLAHEMNNPLASIKALSAHVARSCTDEKTAERVAIVAAEADRLRTIVDGFVTFTRSLDDLRPTTLRPYDIARELATILESRLADRGQTIEVIGDEKLELEADPQKLRQAFHNLLQNAMEASPAGATITVAVVLTKNELVRVRVIDHGEGMTPEVLERIARPHFSTRQGQSGLGIALARAIVEQHGGVLRFESEPSRGTTATVELPHRTPPRAEQLPRPEVDVSTCGRKKSSKGMVG